MKAIHTVETAPRADTEDVKCGNGVHDQWALHPFAFRHDEGWMPTNLRQYHEGRMVNGELMEGYFDEFIPVAYDVEGGSVLKKEIEEKTTYCNECEVPARKYEGDTLCPQCGLLCVESEQTDNLVRDPKAAERIPQN